MTILQPIAASEDVLMTRARKIVSVLGISGGAAEQEVVVVYALLAAFKAEDALRK